MNSRLGGKSGRGLLHSCTHDIENSLTILGVSLDIIITKFTDEIIIRRLWLPPTQFAHNLLTSINKPGSWVGNCYAIPDFLGQNTTVGIIGSYKVGSNAKCCGMDFNLLI